MAAAAQRGAGAATTLVSGWLRAYASVGFSQSRVAGALFCAATLIVPQHGLVGFLALIACDAWARILRRPAAHIDSGFYGFNGLLVGLALGLYFRLAWPLLGLLVLVSLLTVVVSAGLRNLSDRYLGVPIMSLPFVLVTWIALLATRRFSTIEYTVDTVLVSGLGAGVLPAQAELFARSLGACFFQLSVLSGVLIFAGLLIASRWTALLAALGFFVGQAVYSALGGAPDDLAAQFLGFNFILTSIAVGGVFVLLSPGTLFLAAAAGALSAVVSAALLTLLEGFSLPVLALPFLVTTQLVVFALLTRSDQGGPKLVTGEPASPEVNLTRTVFRERRYPDPDVPVFFPPVMGSWIVTQGHHGPYTHQGLWAHGWDFEVADADGARRQGDGRRLDDWLAFRAPVVAPADGKVVRVVNHVPDNEPGEVDTKNNWGNVVVLWHPGNVYSVLAHLQKESVLVREGQPVVRGALLGRVGNSGRSPVPHLHFQAQRSPDLGAPTCPSEFLHYVTRGERDEQRYVTHGVPNEGETIQAMVVSDSTRRALTLAPGRELSWRVATRRGTRTEHWTSLIDAIGGRSVEVTGRRARASLFADSHYFTILDYEGRGDTLLALFSLGAARVPYLDDARVSWLDRPAAGPLLPWPTRIAHELLMPFAAIGGVRTETRLALGHGGAVVVTTELPRLRRLDKLPERVEITFRPQVGPCQIRAWRRGEVFLSAKVES